MRPSKYDVTVDEDARGELIDQMFENEVAKRLIRERVKFAFTGEHKALIQRQAQDKTKSFDAAFDEVFEVAFQRIWDLANDRDFENKSIRRLITGPFVDAEDALASREFFLRFKDE